MIISFLLGSIIGSTLGAFIDKRENLKSFIYGKSVCENCHEKIPMYLNIPIFSYLALGGRCENCKSKIPLRVFAYEVLFGFLNLILNYKYQNSFEYIIRLVESIFLFLIFFTDFKEKMIYTIDIILLFIAENIYKLLFFESFKIPLLGLFSLLTIYFAIYKLSNGMGEADVFLGALSGFFAKEYLEIFFIFRDSFLIAACFCVFLMVYKRQDRKEKIAFCPFIVCSIFLRMIL